MNFVKIAFLFLFIVSIAACDDDDELVVCTQMSWVGTYTGTQDCDGIVEDVTVTITASGPDNIIVKTVTATSETVFPEAVFDDCSLVFRASAGESSTAIDANRGGSQLFLMQAISSPETTATCNISASKD